MENNRLLFPLIAMAILVSAVFMAGCSNPPETPVTGTVVVTSIPEGAEVYFDNEYKGTTPATIRNIPAGSHVVETRLQGYEDRTEFVKITGGEVLTIAADPILLSLTTTITTVPETPAPQITAPQIHVEGYWTWPEIRGTGNPVPLLIHTDTFNTGNADAREVTVSADLYYNSNMVCWNTIYLGTIHAGDHSVKETMVTCTLPSPLNEPDLEIRFKNVTVIP